MLTTEDKDLIKALALKAHSGADKRIDTVIPFGEDGSIHLAGHQTACDIEDYVDDQLKHIFLKLINPYASKKQIADVEEYIYDYIADARDLLVARVCSATSLTRITYLEDGDITIDYADGTFDRIESEGINHD